MRKILSYCKSHIYDIHAVLVGFILVLIMYLTKKRIYCFFKQYIDKMQGANSGKNMSRDGMLRICNLFWLLMSAIIAVFLFAILAEISPFVDFSLQSGLMAWVYALCGEAFIKQIFPDNMLGDYEKEGDI